MNIYDILLAIPGVIAVGCALFLIFVLLPQTVINTIKMNKLIKLQKSKQTIVGITGIVYKI
jgi:hypothetical protein